MQRIFWHIGCHSNGRHFVVFVFYFINIIISSKGIKIHVIKKGMKINVTRIHYMPMSFIKQKLRIIKDKCNEDDSDSIII